MNRRKFLGAAAALATLPATGAVGAQEESIGASDESIDVDAEATGEPVYSVGGIEIPTDRNWDVEVNVKSHPEGVKLWLKCDLPASMDTLLLPEDVDVLCAELQAAKQGLDPEEVSYSREWITERYKPDDAGGGA